ncbi:MAG TPA: TetR/AcrR family transcriptional regulator [Spirochaetota bacterium]|jgi:AcrR family transcriptional regulator|nr:TetR/AcrR family transcriptional regulator [Spirochaetota bacterium]HOK02048.1 TetR/AcrR family transcriptional regulator [Spirochaetota bacterium]HOK92286.1 TetR/AcrR family transcriptional regulator [Spirochaetota bacterium]HON15211.1 TetR/AcrR family transcriptional regulator [Spirochaetota bacterium]HPD78831.1 TetR/AcrR family transcriptional regulator [Spirochaetota bacterium]
MNKSERTRQYIIEVASPIFNKKGYAGTSLRDITEETGLTKGAIYGNFNDKDDLALSALEYNLGKISKIVFDETARYTNSCDKLISMAEAFKKNYEFSVKMGGCPVVNAAVDSDDGNPLLRQKVDRFIKKWKKFVTSIIDDGKEKREIKAEIDSNAFAMIFLSALEGGVLLSKATGNRKYIDSAADHLISLLKEMRL